MDTKRNFFRASGIVYLSIEDPTPAPNESQNQIAEADAIAIKIEQINNKLKHAKTEAKEISFQLMELITDLYQALQASFAINSKKLITKFKAKRYSAIVSGESVEFLSETVFPIGSHKKIHLVLPDYPYETIETNVIVAGCEQLKHADSSYLILLKFDQIKAELQDKIIQYVNTLQRKKIIASKSS